MAAKAAFTGAVGSRGVLPCGATSAVRFPGSPRLRRCSSLVVAYAESVDPLIVRTARGEKCERAPAWMMRQAGRYQKTYRELAKKHPSFRERSENTDLIVQISLQPWESFKPDGVIIFSDILTPLPAMGIGMEIDDNKGPIMEDMLKHEDQMAAYHAIDFDKVIHAQGISRMLRLRRPGCPALLQSLRARVDSTGRRLLMKACSLPRLVLL